MHRMLDLLSSGVHDAKNQLFNAESLLAQAEAQHGIALDEARAAIEQAAARLGRVLTAYKLERHIGGPSIGMASVADLIDEAALIGALPCRRAGIAMEVERPDDLQWPLDRELILDALSNAIQNAARFARTAIRVTAARDGEGIALHVEDDGPGFQPPDLDVMAAKGIGLFVARELARQHRQGGRHGDLALANGGRLGGAVFTLRLP